MEGRRSGKGIDCHLGLTRMSLENDAICMLAITFGIARLHLVTRTMCIIFTCPLSPSECIHSSRFDCSPRASGRRGKVASDQMKYKHIMCSKKRYDASRAESYKICSHQWQHQSTNRTRVVCCSDIAKETPRKTFLRKLSSIFGDGGPGSFSSYYTRKNLHQIDHSEPAAQLCGR